MTEGVKHDQEKARFDLIPAGPLYQLAEIYTFGARKYKDRNWEKGIRWGRIFAAIMRHLWKFWRGEWADEESEMPHLAHAAWGCFTLLEYAVTRREFDDRPKPEVLEVPTMSGIERIILGESKTVGRDIIEREIKEYRSQ